MNSNQDYAQWKVEGTERFYATVKEWDWDKEEFELVSEVNELKTECENCNKTTAVLKPTCNTPSFHATPSGLCVKCFLESIRGKGILKLGDKVL